MLGRGPAGERDVVTVTGPRNLTELEVVALLEQALGTTARRRHVPLGVLDVLHRPVGWVHPGVGRLLHLASLNGAEGDAVDLTPRPGLIIGARTIEDVIDQWASTVSPAPG